MTLLPDDVVKRLPPLHTQEWLSDDHLYAYARLTLKAAGYTWFLLELHTDHDIFNADWNRTTAQFNDPNLVVSPVNSRSDFTSIINSAHHTLLIEAEEMQDSNIEQAITSAAQRGVHVQVILPAPSGSSGDSNSSGIDTIKQAGVQVREDSRLYMHAKIIVVDGQKAFVGSENISTQSLDGNRELGIIVSDQGVLNTLQQTFQQDWGDSQAV